MHQKLKRYEDVEVGFAIHTLGIHFRVVLSETALRPVDSTFHNDSKVYITLAATGTVWSPIAARDPVVTCREWSVTCCIVPKCKLFEIPVINALQNA